MCRAAKGQYRADLVCGAVYPTMSRCRAGGSWWRVFGQVRSGLWVFWGHFHHLLIFIRFKRGDDHEIEV